MRFLQSHVVALANGIPNAGRSITCNARPLQRCLHQTSVAFRPRQRTFFTTNERLARDASPKDEPSSEDPVANLSGKEKDIKTEPAHNHSGGGKDSTKTEPVHNHSSGKDSTKTEPVHNHSSDKDSTKPEPVHNHSSGGKDSSNTITHSNSNRKKGKSSTPKKKIRDPLRRVANIAQRANRKPPQATKDGDSIPGKDYARTICAFCVAESFDMKEVVRALHGGHFLIDPDGMGFEEDDVVHARDTREGDYYIFASGTVVTWSLPPEKGLYVATDLLNKAKEKAHDGSIETDILTEKLEFESDPTTSEHSMRGDTVVLGTKPDAAHGSETLTADIGRAKIAFSSGLARSTKVTVLETLLETFLEATEKYPEQLGTGGKALVTMPTILRHTGEILQLRAQLNFFSELTDSLPDKFWDQRHELGLDSIYDKVGKALDVPSRIRVMNQRMDYADDMLATFRGMLQSDHDSRLEVIIIYLIAIEVVFQLMNWWREYRHMVTEAGGEFSLPGLGLWVLGLD